MPFTSLPVEHLCTVRFETKSTPMVPIDGPAANRVVVNAFGTFAGPRLSGEVVAPSGDWATVAKDGSLRIDVRSLWRTADGADLLVTYLGAGALTDAGYDLRTNPRFEVADERYLWLNTAHVVGFGRMEATHIEYDLYTIT